MKSIELELWKPDQEDQNNLKYAGQAVAEAVFMELRQRLEGICSVTAVSRELMLSTIRRSALLVCDSMRSLTSRFIATR